MLRFSFITCGCVLLLPIFSQVLDPDVMEIGSVLFNAIINAFLGPEKPENARMYEAGDKTPLDYGAYDFVIIGAGSTGAVIANRLSEITKWKVLLLEAGTFPNKMTEIPKLYGLLLYTGYSWGFKSVPQTQSCLGTITKRCVMDTGRGVGGTSIVNGLFYVRGHPLDNEMWAELVDDPSWSYERVLKYYKKSENFQKPRAESVDNTINWKYHGSGGLWSTEHHQPRNQLTDVLLEAHKQLGYNITDYNGPDQIGASVVQYNTKFGKRQDQGTAFILPFLNRANLKVLTESFVTKIEIDNVSKVARGVIFTRRGKTFRVKANKEVILSAGALSSPRILMLSGVGPKEHLKEKGIPVIQDLAVGKTLRNHVVVFGLHFSSNLTIVQQTYEEQIEEYLRGTGILTSSSGTHIISRYKSNVEKIPNYTDLEMLCDFSYGLVDYMGRLLNLDDEVNNILWGKSPNNNIHCVPMLMRTYSAGSVKLKSSNPFDYPLIDSNLFSDPGNKDLRALYRCIKIMFDLGHTEAFRKAGAVFQAKDLPACRSHRFLSKSYWYCYLKQLSYPSFHPMSTCPTGRDPKKGAVVDSKLKVFGVRNLRVADASVFPFSLTGHPNAICAMVGEKISDDIKLEHS